MLRGHLRERVVALLGHEGHQIVFWLLSCNRDSGVCLVGTREKINIGSCRCHQDNRGPEYILESAGPGVCSCEIHP